MKKPPGLAVFILFLGWLMGLEPTTTGITIRNCSIAEIKH